MFGPSNASRNCILPSDWIGWLVIQEACPLSGFQLDLLPPKRVGIGHGRALTISAQIQSRTTSLCNVTNLEKSMRIHHVKIGHKIRWCSLCCSRDRRLMPPSFRLLIWDKLIVRVHATSEVRHGCSISTILWRAWIYATLLCDVGTAWNTASLPLIVKTTYTSRRVCFKIAHDICGLGRLDTFPNASLDETCSLWFSLL